MLLNLSLKIAFISLLCLYLHMKILQLCCTSNLWPSTCQVTSIDIATGSNVFNLSNAFCKQFDVIVASPPCIQFTKANNNHRLFYPYESILLFNRVLDLCVKSGKKFYIENPPGRLEFFFPTLKNMRLCTFRCVESNKEYVIYGNSLLLHNQVSRYSRNCITRSQAKRNIWHQSLVDFFYNNL